MLKLKIKSKKEVENISNLLHYFSRFFKNIDFVKLVAHFSLSVSSPTPLNCLVTHTYVCIRVNDPFYIIYKIFWFIGFVQFGRFFRLVRVMHLTNRNQQHKK